MKKIFITRKIPLITPDMLRKHFHVDLNPENVALPKEKLIEIVHEYDGILTMIPDRLTSEVLSHAKNLKVISNFAAGLDNIDLNYAKERGITVHNCPETVTNSTADATFAVFLSFLRKIPQGQRFVWDNLWKGWDPCSFLGEDLPGKTFGIIGFGRIGQAVARRALGFDLNVIVYQRTPKPIDDPRIKAVSLEEMYETVDYLSLHTPLTDETRHMINYETIKKMKKRPIIINMARGPVVHTDDLLRALQENLLRGAALDVIDPEPISGDHPICHLDNCLVVPHIGTSTSDCREIMAKAAAQNLITALNHAER